MICFQVKHPTYDATQNEAAEILERECRTGFFRLVAELDVLPGCFGVVVLSMLTTQRRQRLFFLKYLVMCTDVQMLRQYMGEILFSPCSVLILCL